MRRELFLTAALFAALLVQASAYCGVEGESGKFAANETGVNPAPYMWQVSPCEGAPPIGCSGPNTYITQYDENGACDPNNLQCHAAANSIQDAGGKMTFNYICAGNAANGEKTASIIITCAPGSIKMNNEVLVSNTGPNSYHYLFTGSGECSSGFDAGWVFVIIVLVGLVLYFAGGFAFNFFVRKLRGAEAVPNLSFWKDLPYLVKDGFMFVFGRFCGRSGFATVK
jgi:hypothetical protein